PHPEERRLRRVSKDEARALASWFETLAAQAPHHEGQARWRLIMRKNLLAALIATFALALPASAENYPSRPITAVVPFSAGGPTDAMMRILGERMKVSLGEAILVENTTGAGGSIGVGRVAHAAPDGYTISIGHLGTHVANGAIYKLNYDLVADLEPIVLLPSN